MNEKVKYKIKSTVEKLGIIQCRQIFGDDIIKQVYFDNPESYLDQFKGLTKIDDVFAIDYRDKHDSERSVFYYTPKSQRIYFNNDLVWRFFYLIMGYNRKQVEKTLRIWLKGNYNIEGYLPVKFD